MQELNVQNIVKHIKTALLALRLSFLMVTSQSTMKEKKNTKIKHLKNVFENYRLKTHIQEKYMIQL